MEPVKSVQQSSIKKKSPDRTRRYPAEFKLQIVKKYLEENVPVSVIQEESGVSGETICRWVRFYRLKGEAGLETGHSGQGQKLPSAVKQKIIELKEANPLFGIIN